MKKIKKSFLALIFCLFAVLCSAFCYVYGADEKGSVSLSFEVPDAEFSLYRVGDFTERNTFVLTGAFAECNVDLNIYEASGWNAVAETLNNYVSSHNDIQADKTAKVTEGYARFDDLDRGLYMVSGYKGSYGGFVHSVSPFMVCLPNVNFENEWTYDVSIAPKDVKTDDGGGSTPEPVYDERHLVVAWQGDNDEIRPYDVEYTLYCDGEVFDKIHLGPVGKAARIALPAVSVDWRYDWDKLEPGHTWSIEQASIPQGYTTVVTEEDKTFVIINTYRAPEPETEPPTEAPEEPSPKPGGSGKGYVIGEGDPDGNRHNDPTNEHYPYTPESPSESEPYVPGESVLPGSSEEIVSEPEPEDVAASDAAVTVEEGGESLPQTGQLWFPVPILAAAGMILFVIGYIRYKGKKDE